MAWLMDTTLPLRREMPAGFQNTAEASSATAVKAPPIPTARAPIPIFRNWAPVVPTLSKALAACTTWGTRAHRAAAIINLFTTNLPVWAGGVSKPGSSNDHKTTPAQLTAGFDDVQV